MCGQASRKKWPPLIVLLCHSINVALNWKLLGKNALLSYSIGKCSRCSTRILNKSSHFLTLRGIATGLWQSAIHWNVWVRARYLFRCVIVCYSLASHTQKHTHTSYTRPLSRSLSLDDGKSNANKLLHRNILECN